MVKTALFGTEVNGVTPAEGSEGGSSPRLWMLKGGGVGEGRRLRREVMRVVSAEGVGIGAILNSLSILSRGMYMTSLQVCGNDDCVSDDQREMECCRLVENFKFEEQMSFFIRLGFILVNS